jgi:hypothetical protein
MIIHNLNQEQPQKGGQQKSRMIDEAVSVMMKSVKSVSNVTTLSVRRGND